MPTTDKVKDAAKGARPVVERLAKDDDFQKHVRNAFDAARHVYDEVLTGDDKSARRVAQKLAVDSDLQDELRAAVAEIREAGRRVKKAKQPSHGKRNTLLLAGILLGILYNPATGPETRRWIREKIFGPEETFEYEGG